MKIPRVRLTVRRMMTVVAVVSLLLLAQPDALWVGHATIPLDFLILDAPTGQPIGGASISLDEGSPSYTATTSPDGRATVVIRATTAGRSSLLRRTRSVNYGWALRVSAGGREGVTRDLNGYTRDRRYHADAAPPPIVVRLKPVRSGQ